MINLCGLIILSLFLPGDARRSFRIQDSRNDAQQQHKMLTKDYDVLAEGKDALIPAGLKKPLFHKGEKLLPQRNAPPRSPNTMMMNPEYGRWIPGRGYARSRPGPWGSPMGSPRGGMRWGRSWDRQGMGAYEGYDMDGYAWSQSPPAPQPVPPLDLTFDDIFNLADPDKKYADKYEALKKALAAQDIHTVEILAGLSRAEVHQIPDLTTGLRQFLEKAISPHRPQPMFDDRAALETRDNMGGYVTYGRRGYDMDGYGRSVGQRRWRR